jgi:hypothetical protein
MKFLKLKLVLLLIFACLYKADIPVHCVKSQIIGNWVFRATETKQVTKPEELYAHTCGHKNPTHESNAHLAKMDDNLFTKQFTVTFAEDSSIIYKDPLSEKVKFQYNLIFNKFLGR